MTIPVKISNFCMEKGNFSVILDARKDVLNDNGNQDPGLNKLTHLKYKIFIIKKSL